MMKELDENTDNLIIGLSKIIDNIKKCWWIIILCLSGAFLVAIVCTLNDSTVNKKSVNEQEYMYMAKSLVYITSDFKELELLNEKREPKESIAFIIYKKYFDLIEKNILYDCRALLDSKSLIEKVNNKLAENNMQEYDSQKEILKMDILENSRMFYITLQVNKTELFDSVKSEGLSNQEVERMKFLVDIATEVLLEDSKKIFGIEKTIIIDKASVNKYAILEDGSVIPNYFNYVEKQMEDNSNKQQSLGSNKFVLTNIINMKNIIIVLAGFFAAGFIIFLYIIFDQKIRTKKDFEFYFNYPLLGEISKDNDENYQTLSKIFDYLCEKEQYGSILITGADNAFKTEEFIQKFFVILKKNQKKVEVLSQIELEEKEKKMEVLLDANNNTLILTHIPNANKSSLAVEAASVVDAVLLIVSDNNENISDINVAINNIEMVDGKIMGCVLMKNRE